MLTVLATWPWSGTRTPDPQTFRSGQIIGTKQQNLLRPPANLDSISVCLYLKLLKRGYTLYVTDGRPSLHIAKLRFLDQGRDSNAGSRSTSICLFISQTRKLAQGSTFRFQFWVFETKEYGAKPSMQQTEVSCLQLAASATLVKVVDSNARSLNFGFWLYMNKTTKVIEKQ